MSENSTTHPEPEFVAFVGIDWADQKHAWCWQRAGATQREHGEVEHTPEMVEGWVSQLAQRFGPGPIAVAVEQRKGALVYMLSKYECLHLFPVPSTMSASMRKSLYPSGSKDDPRDAELLLDLLLQHRKKLRRLTPDNEVTRRIQNLVEERRTLVDEKTAQLNRLTGYLKVYFPQMLSGLKSWTRSWCVTCWSVGFRWRSCKRYRPQSCGSSSVNVEAGIKNSPSAAGGHRPGHAGHSGSSRAGGETGDGASERTTAAHVARGGSRIWTARSRRQRAHIRIFSFLSRCPERGARWRRACWRRLAPNAIAMAAPRRYRSIVGSHR